MVIRNDLKNNSTLLWLFNRNHAINDDLYLINLIMARHAFFSFKYDDVTRANVVRHSWVAQGKEAAGFIDSADFEEVKRQGY